jgi:hypothetical protein
MPSSGLYWRRKGKASHESVDFGWARVCISWRLTLRRPIVVLVSPQGRPDGSDICHVVVQAVPLRAKDAGLAVLPVWVAWKPMLVDAPGASEPL